MALTAYEERVIAELEVQLGATTGVDAEARSQERRSHLRRLPPSLACLLGGLALLLVARQPSLVGRISLASGFSAASIALTFVVIGCVMALASAPVVRRVVRTILGGQAEPGHLDTRTPG
jgi:hypothetical protein